MKIDSQSNVPKRIYLTDYQPPQFRVESLDLHFDLHETATVVTAIQKVEKINEAPLVLNGERLVLKSIEIDGVPLTSSNYTVTPETLTLHQTPAFFTLKIVVELNPQENKSCSGLYLSSGIFATQCEAEGFRNITYFLDRPDVMTSYSVTLEADQKKYPVLLSNGDLISKIDLPNGRHQAIWKDPHKKPCYLFALVAGDLGVIQGEHITTSGKRVKLEVYASHGKQARCHHALESLKKSMLWDEETYGLEYDLNQYMIVSIDDFNMGAMENKGLNIFNSRLVLADPQTATDTDFERIESVVGHEYFHNWTGNRVTCRNWFELSLKEGLTVFRDQEFSADLNSRAVQRIKDVDSLRSGQFAEDAGPNSHPVRPESCLAVDNFYTATIYEKGAEVIRMMQTIVGRKGFRKGMDEYFRRHDGQAVTIIDFADAIAAPNQADFSQFKLWYSQSGTPEVTVTENYDASKKEFNLILTQKCAATEKQPTTKPFHIPLMIGLLDEKGQDMAIRSKDVVFNSDEKPIVHLKQANQSFVFTDVATRPVLSLNREFSAPIKLHWKARPQELLHLIKYDRDAFNRREAAFKMISEELHRMIKLHGTQQPLTVLPEVIEALTTVLTDSHIDPQFKALMLQLPDHEMLAQDAEVLNAESFCAAEDMLITTFVKANEATIISTYKKHCAINKAGDRALKNILLRYMVQASLPMAISAAFEQYKTAQNMTDQIGSLNALTQVDATEADQALNHFFERWKDDAVVFNKWLMLQANRPLRARLTAIQKITQTTPYSVENPNNVYALLTLYATNYLAIQSEPASFAWLCDELIKIDKKNPQVAARLSGCFNFVPKFPEAIRLQAQREIRRVLADESLSKNSRELLEGCV